MVNNLGPCNMTCWVTNLDPPTLATFYNIPSLQNPLSLHWLDHGESEYAPNYRIKCPIEYKNVTTYFLYLTDPDLD